MDAKLTHNCIERTVLEWQSLAIRIDRPIRRCIRPRTGTRDHLQRDVRGNDEPGIADHRNGHHGGLPCAGRHVEHVMTLHDPGGGKQIRNSQPRPSTKVAVIG